MFKLSKQIFAFGFTIIYPLFIVVSADAAPQYVAVVHDLSIKAGDVLPPRLLDGSYDIIKSKTETGYLVSYNYIALSKKECKKIIKNTIKDQKNAYKPFSPDDSRYINNKNAIFSEAYVIGEIVSVYYCLPVDMWAGIKSYEFEYIGNNIIYENDAILRKNNADFIQKLHKCGITDYNFFHINMPDTPFVCNEYSETNPVPHKSYDDITGDK